MKQEEGAESTGLGRSVTNNFMRSESLGERVGWGVLWGVAGVFWCLGLLPKEPEPDDEDYGLGSGYSGFGAFGA